MSIHNHLYETYLFRGVPEQDRQALVDLMQSQTFDPGDILFKQGDASDSLYVIVKGKIQIYIVDEHNNRLPLRDFTPGRTLGEVGLLDMRPRSATGEIIEPTEVLKLNRDDFLHFVHTRPMVGLSMMRDLVERLRYTTDFVQQIMNATTQLSEGSYEGELERSAQDSQQDENISNLVRAFIEMVQNVQAREQSLRQKPSDS